MNGGEIDTGMEGRDMQEESHGMDRGGPESGVEDTGRWFALFLTIFIFLFASAFAFLVHSVLVTFN